MWDHQPLDPDAENPKKPWPVHGQSAESALQAWFWKPLLRRPGLCARQKPVVKVVELIRAILHTYLLKVRRAAAQAA